MKGPHAAALAAGWLAVALSMAALATAAISRVGTETSGAQAQVTITMTATARATGAPTAAPSSLTQIPSATPTAQATLDIPPATGTATQAQTTQAGRSSAVSRTTLFQPLATAPAATTNAPFVAVPSVGVVLPSTPSETPTTSNTKKPTPTRTTKTPTSSATSTTKLEAEGVVVNDSWWTQRQGAIHAGCRGNSLAYAEPWAAPGFQVAKNSTGNRTAISFQGATPVTVLVGCHDGHVIFSTSS